MHAAQGTSSPRPEPPDATYLQPFGSRLSNKEEGERHSRCQAVDPERKASIWTHQWQGWLVLSRSCGRGGQDASEPRVLNHSAAQPPWGWGVGGGITLLC